MISSKNLSSSNPNQVVKQSDFDPNSKKVLDGAPPTNEKSNLNSMKELRARKTSSDVSNPNSISHDSGNLIEETTELSQLERKSTTPGKLSSSSSSKKLLKSESKLKLPYSKSRRDLQKKPSKPTLKLSTSSKLLKSRAATGEKTPPESKATLTRTSTSKLPLEGKREKTTSEGKSKPTHTHTKKTAADKLVPISESTQPTEFNLDYFGDDVIRAPIHIHHIALETISPETAEALEEAKEELRGDAVPKDDTFLRQCDFTPKTVAFWAAQEADSAIEPSLVEVFKESARNTTKFARYNTKNGVLEVNEAILSKEERQELRSQITNVFNHIFRNANKVLSTASLELLKEAARFIEDKDTYPKIKATVSSVLFLRILQPMIDQYVNNAQKSGATDKELCAMRYIQQTVMTFASNPTKPLSKAKKPSPAKTKFFEDLKKELAPNLARFMKTLLGDLSVIKT
jgi:hypothetical protein